MGLKLPDLDDSEFEELVEDARKRIPVHSESWTDHNAHDPGITFLELLAWVTESDIYQLDRLTDAHIEQYLQLVGVSPRPPQPATVRLSLDVSSRMDGREVAAGEPLLGRVGPEIVESFRTESEVTLTTASIEATVSQHRNGRTDNTTANDSLGMYYRAFGDEPAAGDALYLGLDSDPFANADRLDLAVDFYEGNLEPQASHGEEDSEFEPSHRVAWEFYERESADDEPYERWYDGDRWTEFEVVGDETTQFYQGGIVSLAAPDVWPGPCVMTVTAADDPEEVVFEDAVSLEDETSTLVAAGEISDGATEPFTPLLLEDETEPPAESALRLAHVSPDAGPVDVTVAGTDTALYEDAKFGDATGYAEVSAGEHTLEVRAASANNEGEIVETFDVEVENATAHTAFVAGYAAPQDAPGDEELDLVTVADGQGVGLRIVHMSPDAPALDIALDTETAATGAEFDDATDYVRTASSGPSTIFGLDQPLYWFRCRIARREPESPEPVCGAPETPPESSEPHYEVPPQFSSVRTNVVTAEHCASETDEQLERREGLRTTAWPDQTFHFDHEPVQSTTVTVGGTEWWEVPDFAGSGPDDEHYVLDRSNGTVRFGDGVQGEVPLADREVRAPSYVYGGGAAGNVPASTEWTFERSALGDVDVTSLGAASGGTDAEPIESALVRAKEDQRTPYRAVTRSDYSYLATHTPGLRFGRAAVLIGDETDDPSGTIRVVVVPYSPSDVRPVPSEGFLDAVDCHLKRHALLSDDVAAVAPTYVGVDVETEIRVAEGSVREQRRRAAEEAIDDFLDPLRGFEGDGWPFGRPVYISEIYEVLEGTEGIETVADVTVATTGGVDLEANESALPYPRQIDVRVLDEPDHCGRDD
jgi:hypothetical protein